MNQLDKQKCKGVITQMNEMLLANLVMVGQIPSHTFEETQRGEFVLSRFLEDGLVEPFTDEEGNVIGIVKGVGSYKSKRKKILISAQMDTIYANNLDHNILIEDKKAIGLGIGDNAVGLSALMILPELIHRLGLELNSDLVLLGSVKTRERGDLAGIRHFIDSNRGKIDFHINLAGLTIGRVDHCALSRMRGDIICRIPQNTGSTWGGLAESSAIMMINDILDGVFRIPLPRRPKTILNIGRISGGKTYSTVSNEASMHFEVRSEDDNITDTLIADIRDIAMNIGAKYGAEVDCDFFSRQHAAGLKFSHPLVRTASKIVESLGYKPQMEAVNSQIVASLCKNIPAVTIGLTTGSAAKPTVKDYINIEPVADGLVQLLQLINAIDKGQCDAKY